MVMSVAPVLLLLQAKDGIEFSSGELAFIKLCLVLFLFVGPVPIFVRFLRDIIDD